MSHRPIARKQARRFRKRLQRRPLDRHINLVEWLRDRGYADTAGAARKMLVDGRVRANANVVGRVEVKFKAPDSDVVTSEYVPQPIIAASLRKDLIVSGS